MCCVAALRGGFGSSKSGGSTNRISIGMEAMFSSVLRMLAGSSGARRWSNSACETRASGGGTSGMDNWWLIDDFSSALQKLISAWKMILPYCTACTERVAKDRRSDERPMLKIISWFGSPGMTKCCAASGTHAPAQRSAHTRATLSDDLSAEDAAPTRWDPERLAFSHEEICVQLVQVELRLAVATGGGRYGAQPVVRLWERVRSTRREAAEG
eukprot:CAMPEP_0180114060 /NCGR_PEP_ID=MMETSP0985-20121206/37100_1 /TAXON_ID=483367 /ORGANISM="non described non described, Strain CCMP 2436" /LENGTH=212 /DNA_ID=CAMNT_0022052577 /DNA_START=581 /DNA_END=1217 /DNA_ORIENTATION=-